MRLGYSILLGELVQAERLAWKDCETWQVTCPICHEPVFKAARQLGDDASTHYLSHYRASTADVSDCELRVGRVRQEEIEACAAEARGQRLRYFLSVIGREIAAQREYWIPDLHAQYRKMLRRDTPIAICLAVQQKMASLDPALVRERAGFYTTSGLEGLFGKEVQAQISLDVIRFVRSPNGFALFKELLITGWIELMIALKDTETPCGLSKETIANVYNVLLHCRAQNAGHARWAWKQARKEKITYADGTFPLSRQVKHLLSIEVIDLILRVPFRRLLIERFGRADWPTSTRVPTSAEGAIHALT